MQIKKYDLIVVGGGILGTFHAFHALRRGKKVLLLEKDNFPVGATVRNFGQVVPSGMIDQWFTYGVRSLAIYKELQETAHISVRNNGSVYIASDDDEQQLIHELFTYYQKVGYPVELLSKQQILEKYPAIRSTYAKEALFFPEEVSVEPEQMIHRVQAYMKAHFETFDMQCNAPVVDCMEERSEVVLRTSEGNRFLADQVVICNGNEFKLLFPAIYAESGQVVSKLQMMRTVPIPAITLCGNILTGLTIRRYESFETYCPSFHQIGTPEHYLELKKWGIHILFKQAIDGSVIIGDSHEYADCRYIDNLGFDLKQEINALILQEAERIVSFDVNRLSKSWAGFYPQHSEKNIVEIDVTPRIHIRTGIGGKGMTAGIGYTEASIRRLFDVE